MPRAPTRPPAMTLVGRAAPAVEEDEEVREAVEAAAVNPAMEEDAAAFVVVAAAVVELLKIPVALLAIPVTLPAALVGMALPAAPSEMK